MLLSGVKVKDFEEIDATKKAILEEYRISSSQALLSNYSNI